MLPEKYNKWNIITSERYMNTLGMNKINLFSCYNDFDKFIEETNDFSNEESAKMSDIKLKLMNLCLKRYEQKNQTEEWTVLVYNMMNNFESFENLINEYGDIAEIDDNELDLLIKTFSSGNDFQIQNREEIIKF